jgi:hypothetical protein
VDNNNEINIDLLWSILAWFLPLIGALFIGADSNNLSMCLGYIATDTKMLGALFLLTYSLISFGRFVEFYRMFKKQRNQGRRLD